jgi:hypothetical protein
VEALAKISGARIWENLSDNLFSHAEASPFFFRFSKQMSSIVTNTITTSKTAGTAM